MINERKKSSEKKYYNNNNNNTDEIYMFWIESRRLKWLKQPIKCNVCESSINKWMNPMSFSIEDERILLSGENSFRRLNILIDVK